MCQSPCQHASSSPPSPFYLLACVQLAAMQLGAAQLPLELVVVVAGNAVAEAGAPAYLSMLNRMQGMQDETGAQQHAWARWVCV